MTEKQKQAINIINRLHDVSGVPSDLCMTDDEYFLLLEMIMSVPTPVLKNPGEKAINDFWERNWLYYKF